MMNDEYMNETIAARNENSLGIIGNWWIILILYLTMCILSDIPTDCYFTILY